jgi:hypothetical protein
MKALLLVTQEYDFGLSSGFAGGSVTSNRRIPVKNALGRSAVVSCEGELILFCFIGFELCINLTLPLL